MKRSIVWFKTDLRLNDNEALFQAIAQSDIVIPVYCIDESHFKSTPFGFKKTLVSAFMEKNKTLKEK